MLPYTRVGGGGVLGGYGRGLVIALTLGGWAVAAFVVLVLPVSPTAQSLLYSAGFAALSGSWALLRELYVARRASESRSGGAHLSSVHYLGSGMRFAFAVEFALWLQSLRMLTPVYVALLVVTYLFLEYLFRAADGRAS